MPKYDWQSLMKQWNDALLNSTLREELPVEAVEARWLGKAGASEAEIAGMEKRLGKTLPLSYREFLAFSNGWLNIEMFIDAMLSSEETNWFRVLSPGWVEAWARIDGLEVEGQVVQQALQVSSAPDVAVMLINPQTISADGEWQAIVINDSDWTEYPSFWEMMQAGYQMFVTVDKLVTKGNQQEETLREAGYTPRQKIQMALEILREQIGLQEQVNKHTGMMGMGYTEGMMEAFRYAEEQLLALEKLDDAAIPARFKALMADLQTRQHQQKSQGLAGLDLMGEMGKIMSGQVSMDDLDNLTGRLGVVSAGEGYLRVWQMLQRVRF